MLATLVRLPDPPASSTAWFAHIVAAQWLWLARLGRSTKELAVWPELEPGSGTAELDHRGQIASELRSLAIDPPYTDLAHAARNGLLE